MEIVISIVSWNAKDMLKGCLSSLRKHVHPGDARVIVVDNASTDGTPEMIKAEFLEVTLIESGSNLGFGKGHNMIARFSCAPFVLFLNPDTIFVEKTHELMLEVMKNNQDIGAVGCRMVNLDGSVQELGFQWRISPLNEFINSIFVSKAAMSLARRFLPYQDPLKSGYVRKLYGGCLMVRRDVLDRVGWFDERFFMYGEDVDLSRRIIEAGFRLYYLSSSKIIHAAGGVSSKAPGQFSTLMQCESIAKLMKKYCGPTGQLVYKVGICIRSFSRLAIIEFLRIWGFLAGKSRGVTVENSRRKHLSMLKWSLGLVHPRIPR
jgi:GT2 family glycosyltransferase